MKKKLVSFFMFLFFVSLLSLSGCALTPTSGKLGEGSITIPTHTIKAPKAGKLLGLILEKGERISKGQPIFAIEDKELDQEVEKTATEIAKATAELKALEQVTPLSVSYVDISTLQNNYQQAQQKALKMNRLLAAGAVSRNQAQLAQLELQNASAALQAASAQQQNTKPASPEELASKRQTLTQLQEKYQELLAQQQKNEALSPCTAIVTEKLINNNMQVQLNQPVLKLLAQDTAIISCTPSKSGALPTVDTKVAIQVEEGNVSFSGKITASAPTGFTVISTEKPEAIKAGTKVTIWVLEASKPQ